MDERLLQAERTLSVGLLDQAEALYRRVLADEPRDTFAMMGLARVSVERGDDLTAHRHAVEAVASDPDNLPARALAQRLGELLRARGELATGRTSRIDGPSLFRRVLGR